MSEVKRESLSKLVQLHLDNWPNVPYFPEGVEYIKQLRYFNRLQDVKYNGGSREKAENYLAYALGANIVVG